MLLELRKLMTSPGETLPFETSVDLSDMPFGGCKPVTEPVLAKGQVRNTAGVLEMTGTVETVPVSYTHLDVYKRQYHA